MTSSHAQASLEGFGSPEPTDRLFFAVLPPAAVAERIAALGHRLQAQLALRGNLRPTPNLHVTLHHLGDFVGLPPSLVESARLAAGRVRHEPVQACFAQAGSFKGGPFVLFAEPDGGMRQLHVALGEQLAACGIGRAERSFVPHLTLLYDPRTVAAVTIEPVHWPVHDLVLIHSLLGRSQYRELGRWPLAVAQ